MLERKLLSAEIIEIIGEFTIIKTKERTLDENGKQYGRTHTWYDICLDNGNGDLVASYDNIKSARKWAKEN